jgi:hypothetical protein
MIKTRMVLLLTCGLVASIPARSPAQDDEEAALEPGTWKLVGTLSLNLAQSSFSNNWMGDDQGAIAWVANGDFTAERQFTKVNWSTQLQLQYGQTNTQETDPDNPGAKVWSTPDKTTDLIQLETVGRYVTTLEVDPYLAFRWDSQFVDKGDPRGDIFINPNKLTETGGIAHAFIKDDKREVIGRVGFGFRQTLFRQFTDLEADKARFSTYDSGFEVQATTTYPFGGDKVLYKGKMLVFFPVTYSQSNELERFDELAQGIHPTRQAVASYWKAPDVNWQNTITAQLTKILAVNFYFQLIYNKYDTATDVDVDGIDPGDAAAIDDLIAVVDGAVRKAGQVKQTLGLGLTFNLF